MTSDVVYSLSKIFVPLTQSPSTLKITPGEIIRGIVLGWHSSDRVFIRVKGVPLLARAYTSLEKGMELTLKVEEVSSQVVLQILSCKDATPNKALPALRAYLACRTDFLELMQPLKSVILREFPHLSQVVLDLTKDISPDYLKEYLHNLGLSFENKLRHCLTGEGEDCAKAIWKEDFKGLLLKLTGMLKEEQPEVLLKNLRNLIQFIECQQIINTASMAQEKCIFLAFPYFAGEAVRLGELSISLPNRHEEGEAQGDSFKVSFLLNMPKLGPIRIDMMVSQKRVWCTFMMLNEGISDFVTALLPDLSERLEQLGYRPEGMSCLVKDDHSLNDNSLSEELFTEDVSTIDFFI